MSSLERFSEYRGFSLERFHCIYSYVVQAPFMYTHKHMHLFMCTVFEDNFIQ